MGNAVKRMKEKKEKQRSVKQFKSTKDWKEKKEKQRIVKSTKDWKEYKIKIYVSTYDNYLQLTKPFAYLFNKFWGSDQEVVVLGYKKPDFELPPNFSFISLAKKQKNANQWSTDLRKFFKSIDDEFFIWTLNDLFLATSVNFGILSHLMSLLDKDVGRICLMSSVAVDNKGYERFPNNVIELNQNAQYRLTVAWSMWNREYLLKYLVNDLLGGDFEIKQSQKAKNDGHKILGTKSPYCVYQCNGVRKGNEDMIDTNPGYVFKFSNDPRTLNPRIIKDMKEKGII